MGGKPLSETRKLMVCEFYKEGLSYKDIAQKLGISDSSVSKVLLENGLRPKRESEADDKLDSILSWMEHIDTWIDMEVGQELVGVSAEVRELKETISKAYLNLLEILKKMSEDRKKRLEDEVTVSFKALGFKTDKTGKFTTPSVHISMNNKKIFYHYYGENRGWDSVAIDADVIEAIWDEMKKRGWNYYK